MSRLVLSSLAVYGLAVHLCVCVSLPVRGEGGRKEVMLFLQAVDGVETKVTLGVQEIISSLHAYRLLSI